MAMVAAANTKGSFWTNCTSNEECWKWRVKGDSLELSRVTNLQITCAADPLTWAGGPVWSCGSYRRCLSSREASPLAHSYISGEAQPSWNKHRLVGGRGRGLVDKHNGMTSPGEGSLPRSTRTYKGQRRKRIVGVCDFTPGNGTKWDSLWPQMTWMYLSQICWREEGHLSRKETIMPERLHALRGRGHGDNRPLGPSPCLVLLCGFECQNSEQTDSHFAFPSYTHLIRELPTLWAAEKLSRLHTCESSVQFSTVSFSFFFTDTSPSLLVSSPVKEHPGQHDDHKLSVR